MNAPESTLPEFPPTDEAAQARLRTADPAAYARRRNFLDGPVTRLSPYLTHGILDLPDAVHALRLRHRPGALAKLEFEFAWREYFHHLWRHAGEGIFRDFRAPPAPGGYVAQMPADIAEARTGVPVVDESVRALYRTGYLHNHQRMWLAAYTVHVRKVAWRAGADWLYPHLLDGDLCSNHLSWQWVAGTLTGKPYLFNADNVARYAPALASGGTVVDATYADLDALARSPRRAPAEPAAPAGGTRVPALSGAPPGDPRPIPVAGRRVRLVHPWNLQRSDRHDVHVGVLHSPFHERFPWSARRWDFVLARMRAICDTVWSGDGSLLLETLRGAAEISMRRTLNPGYHDLASARGVHPEPAPRLLRDPDTLCRSFSRFWSVVRPARSATRGGAHA